MYTSDNVGKNTIAIVLAGGKGERLSPLTVRRVKPSVPYNDKKNIPLEFLTKYQLPEDKSRIQA